MAARRRSKARGKSRQRTKRPPVDPGARERALEALQRMRSDGLSLTRAAREGRTTPETVRKHVGRALVKTTSGRFAATPSDRLTRHLWFLTRDGRVEITVRGSRAASRVARHMAAVDQYLREGRTDALREFRGQSIRVRNVVHRFLIDPEALDRLALAGEISFERLYVLRS